MNRTEQTASCSQSGSSRAGLPGRTHQRTTQSTTCKGRWPLSGGRPPRCRCTSVLNTGLQTERPRAGQPREPWCSGPCSLWERTHRAWPAALPLWEGHPCAGTGGRLRPCSDYSGGSQVPRSCSLLLRALPGRPPETRWPSTPRVWRPCPCGTRPACTHPEAQQE